MAFPVLDGRVFGDPNWTPVPANNLGGVAGVYFKMVRGLDPSGVDSVMVGIMVSKVPALIPSSQVQVILGFVFDETADPPPCAWRLHVQPFANGTPQQQMTLAAADACYWRQAPPSTNNTLGWNGPEAVKHQAWLSSNSKVWSYSNAQGTWSMELKLPVNLVNCLGDLSLAFPPAGTAFRLYVDVLSTPNGGGAGNSQYPWPAGMGITGPIVQNTPSWSQWNSFTL